MKLKFFLLCLALFCCAEIGAQSFIQIEQADKKAKKCHKKGEEALAKKEYDKAIKHFQKVLKRDSTIIDAQVLLGTTYLSKGDNTMAIKHLERAARVAPSFEPKVLYTLFKLHEENGDHKESLAYLKLFDQQLDAGDPRKEKVRLEMEIQLFRDSMRSNPVPFDPQPLSEKINTQDGEYLPAFTADGSQLIFTRRDRRQEDFYLARYDSDSITHVEAMAELNTLGNEGAHCISQDGNLIIFTACDRREGKGSCDLYYSSKRSGKWSEPKNLGSNINTESWESQPSLSPDNKTLYFSSNRPGGKGGKDIWTSKLVDRRWQQATNLEGDINTPGNEETPFIHADNRTLYFRSNHHLGMGSFDIFLARRKDETFEEIQNLGFPVNTAADDGALFVLLDGSVAYFASDKGSGDFNIFKFDIPEHARPEPASFVKFKVLDASNKEAIRANLLVLDVTSNDTLVYKKADENGELLTTLSKGSEYAIYVQQAGYLFHSENVSFDVPYSVDPIEKEIYLQPIEEVDGPEATKSEPVVLRNVFFDSGSAELLEASYAEISKLAALLIDNPEIKIELVGHTDNVGEEEDNLILSKERSEAVKQALMEYGIGPDRLFAIGKGESEPISSNDNAFGRAQNRRTTFSIIREQ